MGPFSVLNAPTLQKWFNRWLHACWTVSEYKLRNYCHMQIISWCSFSSSPALFLGLYLSLSVFFSLFPLSLCLSRLSSSIVPLKLPILLFWFFCGYLPTVSERSIFLQSVSTFVDKLSKNNRNNAYIALISIRTITDSHFISLNLNSIDAIFVSDTCCNTSFVKRRWMEESYKILYCSMNTVRAWPKYQVIK